MKAEIIRNISHFESCGRFANGCNSSFITLIPKTKNPLNLGDYRPINLIGSMYKIVSKIPASRLKLVVGSMVDEIQSTYIEGRHILEGPLIINEVCSWAKKEKKKIFLLNVDFEKPFDSLNWNYLDLIMEQMGFSCKWRGWIQGCLKLARASVLVNGSPIEEFPITKGVRQGDSLSSFLFIIAMKGLNIALKSAKKIHHSRSYFNTQ